MDTAEMGRARCPGGGDAGHQAVLFGGPISGACPGGTFLPVTLSPGLRDKRGFPSSSFLQLRAAESPCDVADFPQALLDHPQAPQSC